MEERMAETEDDFSLRAVLRHSAVFKHLRTKAMADAPENPANAFVERPDPAMEVAALKQVVEEMTGKVQFLVDMLDKRGLLEDHTFTFPDGDIYKSET